MRNTTFSTPCALCLVALLATATQAAKTQHGHDKPATTAQTGAHRIQILVFLLIL